MACVYDKRTLQGPKELISSNQLILDSELLYASERGSWDQEVGEARSSLHQPVSREVNPDSKGLPRTHANNNYEEFISSEISEIYDAAAVNSIPSSETIALEDYLANSAGSDLMVGSSPDSYDAFFGNGMLLDSDLLNVDLSISSTLTFDTSSVGSASTLFDSPYLKLRFIISLHHSVSSTSSVSCRISPFTVSSSFVASHLGQSFLLQNIQSYPKMLLESNDPPPFIHRYGLQCSEAEGNLATSPHDTPESLAVCHNIVQLHSIRTKQTISFLWRTIAQERRRLEEYQHADEWNLVAVLQSLTIYILLRISSSDSLSVDFDNDLIQTMTTIAIKSEEAGFLCTSEVLGEVPSWREWILMESKRRSALLHPHLSHLCHFILASEFQIYGE